MSAVNKFNRMKELNEKALVAIFSNVNWKENSDYRVWAMKIVHITSCMTNLEMTTYGEFIDKQNEHKPENFRTL